MSETRNERSASADATRSRGLSTNPNPNDQRCSSRARAQLLVMPKRSRQLAPQRRQAMYRTALMLSCFGLIVGSFSLERHPLAGALAVVVSTVMVLYSVPEFMPGPRMVATETEEKENAYGGKRPR